MVNRKSSGVGFIVIGLVRGRTGRGDYSVGRILGESKQRS